MQFMQQLLNGIDIGSIYALVALGYSMVYGIVKLINFAHGDIIMVGSYIAWAGLSWYMRDPDVKSIADVPFWAIGLVIGTAIFGCALFGVFIEKVAYKPLRSAARISLLITAIGVSFLLQNLAQLIFTATPKSFSPFITGSADVLGMQISYATITNIAVSVTLMVMLTLFISGTKTGKAMRAVSEDTDAAQLMGINVNRTVSVTFAIGSALAAVAAILYINSYSTSTIKPMMGSMLGLKAFIAAVLGGIGSLPGAMLGGFAIGIIETLTRAYLSKLTNGALSTDLADTFVFAILILVLLIKPSGILGRNTTEKV